MRCFENAVAEIIGTEVPTFEGDDWAAKAQAFLKPLGWRAIFVPIDKQAIVSRRLNNGKVHAEIMYPTLITIIERI